jgi:hypothetical protein
LIKTEEFDSTKKYRVFPLLKTVDYLVNLDLAYSIFTRIKCGSRKAHRVGTNQPK